MINSVREAGQKNYGQVMTTEKRENWLVAMSEELKALEDNGIWLVVVPPNISSRATHKMDLQDQNRC